MLKTIRKAAQPLVWLVSLLLLTPASVFATHQDIARFATELNLATGQLAYELRGSGAHSSIRQRAERLSREAADLVDAVRRNRSQNHVQAQFKDVSQRFASLEQAFLRLNRKDFSPYLYSELDRIGNIYSNLSAEFYYTRGYAYDQPNLYSPPVVIYQQIPSPAYGVPRGFVNPQQYYNEPAQRPDRRQYGRREVLRLPNYDHRSPVLERQQRLDNRRPAYNRGRQGGGTETSRRNHYE